MADDTIGAISGVTSKAAPPSVTTAGQAGASGAAAGARPTSTYDQVSISHEAIEDLSAVSGSQGAPNLSALGSSSSGGQGSQPGISSAGSVTTAGGYNSNQPPGMSVAGVYTSGRSDV